MMGKPAETVPPIKCGWWDALRWLLASYVLMLAAAIAPDDWDYITSLCDAVKRAHDIAMTGRAP